MPVQYNRLTFSIFELYNGFCWVVALVDVKETYYFIYLSYEFCVTNGQVCTRNEINCGKRLMTLTTLVAAENEFIQYSLSDLKKWYSALALWRFEYLFSPICLE